MKKTIQLFFNSVKWVILFAFDFSAVLFSFWCGHRLWILSPCRVEQAPPPFNLADAVVFSTIVVTTLVLGNTYKPQSSVLNVVRLRNIIKSLGIGFIIAFVSGFFSKSILTGRLQTFYTLIILILVIVTERGLIDYLLNEFITQKYQKKRVVIFGAGDTGKRLLKAIKTHPRLGYQVLAFFDDNKTSNSIRMADPIPFMGNREKLVKFLDKSKNKLDSVLIAMPAASSEDTAQIMRICDLYEVPYRFVPSLSELALHRVRQEQLDGIPLFGVRELEFSLASRFIKRIFDLIFSGVTLLVGLPVFGFIAIVIRLDSPGEVIFRQKRVGIQGNEFIMYKFRTMFSETPDYAVHPSDRSDSRVTRVGRCLRRTSLDELPQLFNVLKGDMSMVGPRPEMPFIVEQYTEIHRERLKVKPGITGLWQISGDRSLPIHENIDHDLYYIENQSLLLDIIIILQTFWFALIRGLGAK